MGNRNVRRQEVDLANYGAGYDPYYGYGGIENYGSAYQPTGGGSPFGFGMTDASFGTSTKRRSRRFGALGQRGLAEYGDIYPPDFNPMLQSGSNGPKIRLIYVPNNVYRGFQNLVQPGGAGGMNPLIGGMGGGNPLIGGMGGGNPFIGGMGGGNPFIGGLGGGNPFIGGMGGGNPFIGGMGGGNPLIGGMGGGNPFIGGMGGANPFIGGMGGGNPFIGGMGGANPFIGGMGGANPFIGGMGGGNPLIGGMGGANPFIGGIGGGNPFMGGFGGMGYPGAAPGMPFNQMGSNCCSMSLQLPSMAPQYPFPMPCPPAMIQPVMSQMPMGKKTLYLLLLN
jgi:hypothetical protein